MANAVKFPKMVRVWCNLQPLGNVRQRQPKSPGQKGLPINGAPQTTGRERTLVWANETNLDYRCTYCGHVGHPRA